MKYFLQILIFFLLPGLFACVDTQSSNNYVKPAVNNTGAVADQFKKELNGSTNGQHHQVEQDNDANSKYKYPKYDTEQDNQYNTRYRDNDEEYYYPLYFNE